MFLERRSILVIGDIMLDTYYLGNVNRISPEAPVPIFEKKDEMVVLGGAANTAANLCMAKQHVTLISVIGNDAAGQVLLKKLEEAAIDATGIYIDNHRHTTVKTRFIGPDHQQMFRMDVEDKFEISKKAESFLLDWLEKNLYKFDILVISDYMKGVLTFEFTQSLIKIANKLNKKVLVDVKDENYLKYKGAFLLKPNLRELGLISGKQVQQNEIFETSLEILQNAGCEYMLTTCGGDGMVCVRRDGECNKVSCVSKEVYDVTGAGDTVIAYLAAALANNYSMQEAVNLSNYAAGIKVSKKGTTAVSLEEVLKSIDLPENQKIITLETWMKIKNQLSGKVVFTNGCFDIIHAGHIRYLKEAAKLGDFLIVGLNSDSSVKRLKGNQRPIVKEVDRAEVLASLSCISYVIIFDEETPYKLIKQIIPDVLVKGGDYQNKEIVGRDIVEENNGKVVLIPFVKGHSSSRLIEKIQKL